MDEILILVYQKIVELFSLIRDFVIVALKYVSAEVLVLLIIGAGLVVYFLIGSAANTKRALSRKANKAQEKFCMDYIETRTRLVFDMMNGDNKEAFLKGCQMYLEANNYKLTKEAIQMMLYDNMYLIKNNKDLRSEYAFCKEGEKLVDAIYKTVQIGLKKGPEYEKLKKKIDAEVKKKMNNIKLDIDASGWDMQIDNMTAKEVKEHAFDNFDMQNQMHQQMNIDMQQQMQLDMQMQMQQQMQLDMQMQMQQQMQMDMQMQMQQQMQMDMQMQMQQQMQMDMMNQMQNQMNMDMMNSMNSANQAMTSTDFGGFMNHDANSGNFGPF